MSKKITGFMIALLVLVLCAGLVAFMFFTEKVNLEQQNTDLQTQISDYEAKEISLNKQLKDINSQAERLKADVEAKTAAVADWNRKHDQLAESLERTSSDLDRARREKTDIETRLQTVSRERDDLVSKAAEIKTLRADRDKLAELVKELQSKSSMSAPAAASQAVAEAPVPVSVGGENGRQNEEYLARLEREKAALGLQLEKVNQELAQTKLKVTDLTKSNSDMDIEIGRLKNEKDEISRRIKYGEDLADSLSIELARARNDQRLTTERAAKVDADNQALRAEIKQLTSTKAALEKSIARLTDDKNSVEKKLVETEGIIQSRVDEIWKIKKDIDARFDARGLKPGNGAQVELAPIVVNAPVQTAAVAKPAEAASAAPVRRQGSVVSVNENNNFVVIDIGEKAGVKVGDQFKVYRSGSQIGSIEVIQLRQDISAADIRQKTSAFKPGDTVK